MADLSVCDTDDLKDRLNFLLNELDDLLKEAGPILELIGKRRSEVLIITDELRKRGDGQEVS